VLFTAMGAAVVAIGAKDLLSGTTPESQLGGASVILVWFVPMLPRGRATVMVAIGAVALSAFDIWLLDVRNEHAPPTGTLLMNSLTPMAAIATLTTFVSSACR